MIIGIEGIDGSGKTLQTQLLTNRLTGLGYRCKNVAFPVYENFFGGEIGAMLSGDASVRADCVDAKSMALWYALDRFALFRQFQWDAFDFVILNRYTLANVVYQGIRYATGRAQTPDEQTCRAFADWVFALEHVELGLPKPDIYFILDVDLRQSAANVREKGFRGYVGDKPDVYESSAHLQQAARTHYLRAAQYYDHVRVISCADESGMRPPADICDSLMKDILNNQRGENSHENHIQNEGRLLLGD